MTEKITAARITAQPRKICDPMPEVFVTVESGKEIRLFSYYPDEISFTPSEFIGLTVDAARELRPTKDRVYLSS